MTTKELNRYIKKNRFKTVFMSDRDALMRCFRGIQNKYSNTQNIILELDRKRNYFYIVNNGYLTYYCLK